MNRMNIELKKKKERQRGIIRQILYILLMIFSYVFVSSVKAGAELPLMLIPCAVCYAVREGPMASAVYGSVCGLLLDSASGTLTGFNAIILMWSSLMISLMFHYYLRRNILNFMWLYFITVFIQSALHYLFFVWIWGYDPTGEVMTGVYIPEAIFTNAAGIILFWFTGVFTKRFGRVTEHYIEEKSGDIVRE